MKNTLGLLMLASSLGVQLQAQPSPDTARYAVSYVEVMPSARAAMVAALKQYRDASRQEDGYVRVDLLEQVAQPGHFAIVERWKDQQAFDSHGTASPVKAFRDALQSIRLSDYDQRPYKSLTTGSGTSKAGEFQSGWGRKWGDWRSQAGGLLPVSGERNKSSFDKYCAFLDC